MEMQNVDCENILENSNLCDNCKKQKAKEWLIKAGKVVGMFALLFIGGTCLASILPSEEDEFEKWVNNASHNDLSEVYNNERLEWIKNGYNNGTGEKTSRMNRLNAEISKRVAEEWDNNTKRNRDPHFRWTDANRWDKN